MESVQQSPPSQQNASHRFLLPLRSRLTRFWQSIKPTREARTGALWATLLTVLWAAVIGGLNLESGFGLPVDLAFVFFLALLGIPIAALLIALLLFLLRTLPPLLAGFFAAAGVFTSLLWFGLGAAFYISAILLFVECALGAAIAAFFLGGRITMAKKIVTSIILVLCVAANVGIVSLLRSDGVDSELIHLKKNSASLPAPLALANPSDHGPFGVQTLYYGTGDSLRRPEFGRSVAIRTKTADASAFFKDFTGWKANIRKRLWGFGMDKLPLNAQVWYPTGAGPFPLVLMVHGNHIMSEPSDRGYAYMGELLASRGFIFVSLDENFLNSGLFHDPPKQQAVRGWMMLEHLKLWHEWNQRPGNIFYKKVDVQNIALAGHSRGGEAAATAALFNGLSYYPDDATVAFHYGYKIKSVIAIAPAEGQYKPAEEDRVLKDINYLTIQGAYDSDVSSFMGSSQWDHVHYGGSVDAFKSELYIYRANHGQFNTLWGRTDAPAPTSWLLNLRPLISGDQQRQIAKVYLSSFLEATLHNRKEYVDLFRDFRRGRLWLPDTLYVNRYADERLEIICRFDEDADVTTTTVPGGHISGEGLTLWREGKIPIRDGTRDYNGVLLGWNWTGKGAAPINKPAYSILVPPANQPREALVLSLAVSDDTAPKPGAKKKDDDDTVEIGSETTDFSIRASTSDGASAMVPLSRFATLLPPLAAQFTKLERLDKMIYKNSSEPVFQTASIPLNAFAAENPHFNPAKVNLIQLVFDKTPSRVIIISSVGFQQAR